MDHTTLRQKLEASIGFSNEALSDQEESMAQKLLHEAYDTISSVDAEVLQIRSTLRSLEERRAEELGWIAHVRARMSSERKVPPEVLGRIFELCVDGMLEVPLPPRSPCLILSQVCSRWRRVALAEPNIWNAVSIKDPGEVRPDVLEAILSRAGNAITFCVTIRRIPHELLRVIDQYSDKFQIIRLTYKPSPRTRYLTVPFARLGALQTLQILVDTQYNAIPLPLYPAISAFATAPNPLNFYLLAGEVILDQETPPLLFPRSRLRHLTLHCGMSPTEFLPIFGQCTQLISCNLHLYGDKAPRSLPPVNNTYTLMDLKSMHLVTEDTDYKRVLDSLVAPSLQVLKIRNRYVPSDTLFHFIERSQCKIQTIHVKLLSTASLCLERLLLSIPDTIDVTLNGPAVFSEAVVESIGTRALLPNVEKLECHVSSCKAVQGLAANRCMTGPDSTRGVIRKFTAWVAGEDLTDEWREFCASSDVPGPAQKPKPAEAEPRLAEPWQALITAWDGLRLRLQCLKA